MSKKIDRAMHGPSWTEVIVGAVLSLVLGVVIGAVLLVLRPVVVAREEPKERAPNTVYYIEGSKDGSKAREAVAKRNAFLGGQSVTLTEEEINAMIAAASAKPAAPAKDGAPAAPAEGYFTAATPNVRIRDGVLQVGVPVTISLLDQKVIAQASGSTFVKKSDGFVLEPTMMYLGSCPVQRLPFLGDYVRDKFVAAQSMPEDVKAAWARLANVSVEGNTVKLTMP